MTSVTNLVVDVEAKTIPNYMKYVFGGLSGMMATCIVQPLDLIKTRMQIDAGSATKEYTSSLDCVMKVLKNEGILEFYNGLGAGFLRQATYTTTRMGVYQSEIQYYREKYQNAPTLLVSAIMGVMAGACGAFVGNPAEVALIRMMSDKKAPPDQRRNYKNVGEALLRITKDEGIFGLWRGCMPTVTRAMVVNMVQLASYSQLKTFYMRYLNEGLPLQICSSMSSGFLTAFASMPLDMAKTRIQNQKGNEFKGMFDVIFKVAKSDGMSALWKGFIPYFCRVGPHTVFSFVFLEQLNRAYYKYVLGEEGKSNL